MDICALIKPYGGEVTADARLIVKEETHHVCAEGLESQATKRLKVDDEQQYITMSSFSMPAHRALLWPLSEYFASKVRTYYWPMLIVAPG